MERDVSEESLRPDLEFAWAAGEIAEVARFPEENPNPVFRVAADGRVLYANRASHPLMAAWGVEIDGCVPRAWRDRLAETLTAGESRKWDAECDDRVLQLHFTPILGAGYVNVYAADVTERVALLAQLTEERRRLADAARTAAERVQELETLLELVPVGIAISYDPECKDIRVNPAQARALGMARDANVSLGADESRDRPPYRVFDEAGREPAVEELPMQAAAARGVEVRDMAVEILRSDGTRLTMLSHAAPLLDHAGKPRGAVAAFVDVTGRRASEAERERLLRELEARHRELQAQAAEIRALNAGLEERVQERTAELEAIFASVPDPLFVADATGILRCNQPALESFGCQSVDELKELLPVLAERMQSRYADTGEPIPPSELGLARALRGERVVLETLTRHPVTGREQIHRVAAGPIAVNGQIVAAVALATDITEQKRSQMDLAYQAYLLENVSDAILAYDTDLRITAWNRRAEEIYGWKAEEVYGALAPEVVGSQLNEHERLVARRAVLENGRWQGELLQRRRDGTPVIIEATSVALRDEAGRLTGFATVNRDISGRTAAEAENARLLEELRASREELRGLSRRLVALQEAERSYVADQLYNQAGQVLAALQLQLSRLISKESDRPSDNLREMSATVNEAIRQLHELAMHLRPAGLDRSTLANALRSYVTGFVQKHSLSVQFRPGNADSLRAPAEVSTAVFRAVQEGLAFIAQQAGATEAELSLSRQGETLYVTLSGNRTGRDLQDEAAPGTLELASIRERLEAVGGTLTILNGQPGTKLIMEAPLGNEW